MTPKTSREASRRAHQRRLEVERRLAGRGLLRGPRRVLAAAGPPAAAIDVAELRSVLEELGPTFAAFGRYLAQRADLLPSTDCLLLEDLAVETVPSPIAEVDETLRRELGRPRPEVFPLFEEVPFQCRWLDQSHRARLESGERVVVRVIHAGVEVEIADDLEALAALRGALSDPAGGEHFARVLADFRRTVAARLDLEVEAGDLQALGRDAGRGDPASPRRGANEDEILVVPEVYRELSTCRVLTAQWLPGPTLDELAALPAMPEIDAYDLARRIGLIWMQMALVGHRFPLEADVVELPDGRLAVIGGSFSALPDASRVRLWNYLRATVEHFPDRAAANLLREASKARSDAAEAELRTRVRQVVPFRDGAWSATGESLGEYAVLHWRLLRAAGFTPRRHLDEFYQGLFWAARKARRFAPQKDPLGEAVRDFDWLAGWNQLRQLAAPRQMVATAESYLEALVELPQKVDRILNLATEEGQGFRLPPVSGPASRRRSNASVAAVSLALAMAAVVLLAEPWRAFGAAAGWSAAWSEGLLAAAFLGLGLLWLRAVWSRR